MNGEAGYVVPLTVSAVAVAIVAVLVLAGLYVAGTMVVDDLMPWLRREVRAWRDRRSYRGSPWVAEEARRDLRRAADELGRGGR